MTTPESKPPPPPARYKLVYATTRELLEEAVNAFLEQDWEVSGGPFTIPIDAGNQTHYAQAMILPPPAEEPPP